MRRRGFLKLLASVPVVAAAPIKIAPAVAPAAVSVAETIASVGTVVTATNVVSLQAIWSKSVAVDEWQGQGGGMINDDGHYVVLIHPEPFAELVRSCTARELWLWSYRAWRLDGRPQCELRDILKKYPLMRGELVAF